MLREAPDAAFGYADRSGAPALRAVLAAYLGRARGVVAEPAGILVCTGITQAVGLLARALRRAGVERIAVEDPGFPVHRLVFAREGLRTLPVPVDEAGLHVDALEALRLGWAVLPPGLQDGVEEAKVLADSGSPQLDQLALARFMERGDLDRHLRRMRGVYRRRRDRLVAALARELPELRSEGIEAGLHVAVRVPDAIELGPLLERAWGGGVGPLGFRHGDVTRLLLGYGNLPEPSVEPAVRALAASIVATDRASEPPGELAPRNEPPGRGFA